MQICAQNNTNFKGNLGQDDSISLRKRTKIREHLEGDIFQKNDFFVQNGRLEEYALNKLLSRVAGKNNSEKNKESGIDYAKLKSITNLCNIEPVKGTSSYRGSTAGLKPEVFKKLKEAGVKGIVTFAESFPYLKEAEENKLEIFHFPVDITFWKSPAFDSREDVILMSEYICNYNKSQRKSEDIDFDEVSKRRLNLWELQKRTFIDKFTDFVCEMKKSNRYIGCAWGVDRTDEMLTLNYLFNPDAKDTYFYFSPEQDENITKIKKLYENLTPKDKAKMGWDEQFDKSFLNRLRKMAPGVQI